MRSLRLLAYPFILCSSALACGGGEEGNPGGTLATGGKGAISVGGAVGTGTGGTIGVGGSGGNNPGSGGSAGGSGTGCGSNLTGRVRDFAESHPDFEYELGNDRGIVTDM